LRLPSAHVGWANALDWLLTEPGAQVPPEAPIRVGEGGRAAIRIGGPDLPPLGRPEAERQPATATTLPAAPAERVAFILHDVFGYPFAEVAEIVGRTPAACRQLASTARRRVRTAQPPATPTARQASIVRAFKQAWEARDIGALIGLLDPDATAIADGRGLAGPVLRPVQGGEQVARGFVDVAGRVPGLTILERTVNGQPGLVAQQDGVTVAVMAFEIAGDQITRIWVILNPGKLRPWASG
jgi:hypothetical protein